jgi:hypothetical protein
MSPESEHDRLLELLSGIELLPDNPNQREAIFSQTCGILRRRRMLRRISWLAALSSCYVLGVCTVLAWQAGQHRDRVAVRPGSNAIEIDHSTRTEEPTTPSSTAPNLPEASHSVDLAPTEITQSLPEDDLTTFERMRRAGDRQLNERGNVKGAIGCYRRALEFASDDDLQIVPERDSWLLIPLKKSRMETRKHVYKKS